MYTQNGSPNRYVEAVLVEVIWPEFIAQLEAGDYGNKLFVSLRFLDFTPGYDTNSAVLFPETVAMREIPQFTWGAIFQDREAARYRRVVRAAAEITRLELPADAARMLDDQALTEQTFVMWDIIHDRTHMRGDLPFDPFMIKQRMPYFLYSLEELRCDLTAFRECVAIQGRLSARVDALSLGEPAEPLNAAEAEMLEHAKLVQYAVIFDRIFRFSITGSRVRNYDGLGGQLLFAWLHQRGVLHWTDTALSFDWENVPAAVVALGEAIDELYWRSIDRPKTAHWLAAYELVRATLTPNPASAWARGLPDDILAGAPEGLHRRRPGRRVPAVDVLRGARQEDEARHRVDGRHHRLSRAAHRRRVVPAPGSRRDRTISPRTQVVGDKDMCRSARPYDLDVEG